MNPKLAPVWLIALAVTLSSCGNEQTALRRKIQSIEAKVELKEDHVLADDLILAYQDYAKQFPQDHEVNGRYLYRAAGLAIRMNRYSLAVEILHQALRDHYPSSNTLNNAVLLGTLYAEKLGNAKLAEVVWQATVMAFPDKAEALGRNPKEGRRLTRKLRDFETMLDTDLSGTINFRQANDFINAATLYAMLMPQADDSPHWLFQAAETARKVRVYSMAIGLYDWLGRSWPGSREAAQALFLKAYILDNDLRRKEEAKVAYEAYLQKFPTDDYSEDARIMLKHLGRQGEAFVNEVQD